MLKSIKFTTDWRVFQEGMSFTFTPGVNLLVGDQGCGKSSLLKAIRGCGVKLPLSDRDWFKEPVADVVTDRSSECFKFDFEYDNIRTKSNFGENVAFQVQSYRHSHGETNQGILGNLVGAVDSILFMDEPDMALSVRSILGLVEKFKTWTKDGNQIIAAVHNPLIIKSFPLVLSLEHGQWMSSQDFIGSQYKNV